MRKHLRGPCAVQEHWGWHHRLGGPARKECWDRPVNLHAPVYPTSPPHHQGGTQQKKTFFQLFLKTLRKYNRYLHYSKGILSLVQDFWNMLGSDNIPFDMYRYLPTYHKFFFTAAPRTLVRPLATNRKRPTIKTDERPDKRRRRSDYTPSPSLAQSWEVLWVHKIW